MIQEKKYRERWSVHVLIDIVTEKPILVPKTRLQSSGMDLKHPTGTSFPIVSLC